jgi:hypothetical protein
MSGAGNTANVKKENKRVVGSTRLEEAGSAGSIKRETSRIRRSPSSRLATQLISSRPSQPLKQHGRESRHLTHLARLLQLTPSSLCRLVFPLSRKLSPASPSPPGAFPLSPELGKKKAYLIYFISRSTVIPCLSRSFASTSSSRAEPTPAAASSTPPPPPASLSPKISAIVDQISTLTLLEAADLVDALKVRSLALFPRANTRSRSFRTTQRRPASTLWTLPCLPLPPRPQHQRQQHRSRRSQRPRRRPSSTSTSPRLTRLRRQRLSGR